MKVAALDLGSNTFLCLIAEVESSGRITVLADSAEVVRLGQGVAQNGEIAEEALDRARACLLRFKDLIAQHQPLKILGVATAATRKASNGHRLLEIGKQLGLPIQIISGEREAELSYQGAVAGNLETARTLVVDIGGGSTELIFGLHEKIQWRQSVEVGVVRLREAMVADFPISLKTRLEIERKIDEVFSVLALPPHLEIDRVLAVAGTPTTLAAAALGKFDSELVDGYQFSQLDLLTWLDRLCALRPEQIENQFHVPKGRSDVLAVGIMILLSVLKLINIQQLSVSVRGLRYGVAGALGRREHIDAI